jgi:hypothetical protein
MPDNVIALLGPAILVTLLAGFLTLLAFSIRICIGDAHRRGKSPVLVCIACILFFPWGMIAWLIFRPEPQDTPRSNFRLEDHRLQ